MNDERLSRANALSEKLKTLRQKRAEIERLKHSERGLVLTDYDGGVKLNILDNKPLENTILVLVGTALDEIIERFQKEYDEL